MEAIGALRTTSPAIAELAKKLEATAARDAKPATDTVPAKEFNLHDRWRKRSVAWTQASSAYRAADQTLQRAHWHLRGLETRLNEATPEHREATSKPTELRAAMEAAT